MTTEPPQIYEFGRFRLDAAEHTLWRGGELVPLTPKVFGILLALVENSGRVVGKDELMWQVWPDSFVEEGNLTQNVSLLRKALGETGDGKPFIETVARRGYRFAASVNRAGDGQAAAGPASLGLVGEVLEAGAANETPARAAFAMEPLSAAGALLEGAAERGDNGAAALIARPAAALSPAANGDAVLTLISDDNFSLLQRTVLLQFKLLYE